VAKPKINPILVIFILAIVAFFFFNQDTTTEIQQSALNLFAVTETTIDFAGFSWQSSGNVELVDETVILRTSIAGGGSDSAKGAFSEMKTDVTGIDELLVIAEGDIFAKGFRSDANAGIQIQIIGSESGIVTLQEGVSTTDFSEETGRLISKHVDARIFKLKNNFDGTWSTLESLGVGDIFIIKDTKTISGTPTLSIRVFASLGSIQSDGSASAGSVATVYNVVRKESGFAVCKADEFIQDVNQDGIITPDECFDLTTIVLNSEEAIKESFDAKLARIELELLAKNEGLSAELERLKQLQNTTLQQQRLSEIEEELLSTRILLDKLQDREQELLDAIRANEKITVINQTVVIIQPTVVNQTIIEKTIFIGGEKESTEIPTIVVIIGIGLGIFVVLKLLRII